MKAFLTFLAQFEPGSRIALVAFAVVTVALEIISLVLLSGLLLLVLSLGMDTRPAILSSMEALLPAASERLPFLFAAVFVFILAKNVALAELWRRTLRRLSREQAKFTRRLFEHYLRIPYPLHLDMPRMAMQHNLNIALDQVFLFLVLPALQISLEMLVTLAILAYLFAISPVVTAALILWLGTAFWIFRLASGRASNEVGRGRREALDRMLRLAQESFVDIRSIKIWAREPFFANLFGKAADRQSALLAKERFLLFAPRFLLEPMLVGALVLFAAVFVLEGAPRAALLEEISLFTAAAIRI